MRRVLLFYRSNHVDVKSGRPLILIDCTTVLSAVYLILVDNLTRK